MNIGGSHVKHRPSGLAWILGTLFAVLLTGSAANPQTFPKPFSADEVKTTNKKTESAKVYVGQDAIRSEGVKDGQKYIAIMRYDRKVIWSVIPEQKMYFEMPMPAGAEVAAGMKEMMKDVQVKREALGSEEVNGFRCDKTRMTVTWQGVTSVTTEWNAKDLGGFAVKKVDEKTGEITEYKNIRPGPQDPALFDLPAGYKKMSFGAPH